ncbi:hypothetical protein A3B87_00900 [Candidatus Kuenenbacteria bacterium RIFCSPHIGHO2_02_FULL_39_13]|uniref:Methyltransferase type 11 domain-containing protein n=1 Tax=Candidatus Kuenenbacteria bacterium RIFCSPHIGHO2_02_FULL_39_13 TaxID=1798561 RepID=A0A1F6FNH7_9BACT|nr:MAG: hypothetical protein A3B87_00900 [Candidatus Kuenenbacteria bacterium RIFCSPHIGHO2_02_FULL_39_13]
MEEAVTKQYLDQIHKNVPADYYETGIKHNLLQRCWHLHKFRILKKIFADLPQGGKSLDLGCHSGMLTDHLRKIFNTKMYGIDISGTAIQYAQNKYPANLFLTADLTEGIPFRDNFFDIVTAFDVLEHISNPQKIGSEIKRVLKNQSILIIGIPNENLLFKMVWYFWVKCRGKVWQDVHVNCFDENLLYASFSVAGFEKIKEIKTHLSMWKIIIYKINKNKELC